MVRVFQYLLFNHPSSVLYAAGSVVFSYGIYLLDGDVARAVIWLGAFILLGALLRGLATGETV